MPDERHRGGRGEPPTARRFDAVFVGAGINALGCAIEVASAGWSVALVDAFPEPGGAVRTASLTLPGFHHDLSAMNLTGFAAGPFAAKWGEALAAHGGRFMTCSPAFGTFGADGRFLAIGRDGAETEALIHSFAPEDVAAWRTWRADFDRLAPALFAMLGGAPGAVDGETGRIADGLPLPPDAREAFAEIVLGAPRAVLGRRFRSETLRAALAAWALHLDYAADGAGGVLVPFLDSNIDSRAGLSIVEGGSGRMTGAMAALAASKGAAPFLGRRVERIQIDRGRATGVALEDGTLLEARRAVVLSVVPTALPGLLGSHMPGALAARCRTWRYGPGTFMLHLALDGPVPWRDPLAGRTFYAHIAPTLDAIERAHSDAVAGIVPAAPLLVVGQPTLFDPSRAPPGKHVLWVMARAVPAAIKGDAIGTIAPGSWSPAAVDTFAERILTLIEEHAPGLRRRILARHAVPPDAFTSRISMNLVDGDLLAGSHRLDQFHARRPFPGHSPHKLPVEGLWMLGASTWPGAGAMPGSGAMVAGALLGAG